MKDRVQVLRAIAIIAVVIIHNMSGNKMSYVFARPLLNFGTAMFVFLSGYLTKPDISNVGVFYKKRISRVLIPYILWTLAYSLVYKSDLLTIIINLLTTTVCYAFYYCFTYIQLVLVTPLLSKYIEKKWSWLLLLVQPIYLIITQYVFLFTDIKWGYPLNGIFLTGWLTYYYVGLKYKSSIGLSLKRLLLYLVISIIVQIFEGMIWYRFGYMDMSTTQSKLSAIVTNIIIIQIALKYLECDNGISKIERFLTKLGDCSFGVFLSHVLLITILSNKVSVFNYLPVIIKAAIVITLSFLLVITGRIVLGKKYSHWLGLS